MSDMAGLVKAIVVLGEANGTRDVRIAELDAENAALREERDALRKENEELVAQLDALTPKPEDAK